MSQIKTLNGVQYTLPQYNDTGWGANTGNVLTQYMAAIADVTLQLSGGSFTITADANFGATYGLVSAYFTSRTANAATAGAVRLAKTDVVSWRNNANGANVDLSKDTSDNLLWATNKVYTAGGAAGIVNADIAVGAAIAYSKLALSGSIVNADLVAGTLTNTAINASAAIALTKLAALTASRVPVLDASGFLTASSVTATTLAFLDATSSIQTQLNGKASTAGTLLTTTDQTATGVKTFSGQLIGKGTATNDDAAAGYIGEYVSSIDSSGASVGSSGTYFDITSISLTAGDWDISLFVSYGRNGATLGSNDFEIGIGTATGNSATGLTTGDTLLRANANFSASFIFCDMYLGNVRKSLAGTTTIYAKGYFDGYSVATPKKFYRMVARRVR